MLPKKINNANNKSLNTRKIKIFKIATKLRQKRMLVKNEENTIKSFKLKQSFMQLIK